MSRWAGIARMGGVGDNLIAASPLPLLKRMGYMTEVISSDPNHVVYLNNPFIDKLTIKKGNNKDLIHGGLPQNDLWAWQQWFASRAEEYDLFVHASHSCEGRHAVFKQMTAFWWPEKLRRKVLGGSYLETLHDLAEVPYKFGPLFFPTAEEYAAAFLAKQKIGERFILWVLSGTRVDKVYPYATMAVPRILKELGAPVVVMGGPSEKEHAMANAIRDAVQLTNSGRDNFHIAVPPIGSSEGSWPLRTSLTFALCADLVVTPDTGTAWAVAFEQMPKIVMVSHASAENITKHWVNTTTLHADPKRVPCWPCHRLHDTPETCVENKEKNGAACISDISVERLVQAVAEKWTSGKVIHAEHVFSVAGGAKQQVGTLAGSC